MTPEEKRQYFRDYYLKNNERVRQYRKINREKINERSRKWAKSNNEKCKKSVYRWRDNNPARLHKIDTRTHLKKRYGITPEDYAKMLSNQSGGCEICGKPSTNYKRRLHVDHDHLTGNLRGLLCVKCNLGIGYFNDSVGLLDNAKEYLVKYSQ